MEKDQNCPRLLATLVDHNGPVNAVRFAHSGKALASAADDKTMCVYDLMSGSGKQVLGGERNIENWQRRGVPLRGHDNNVTDVDWSHDDQLLASCSLDNHIIIWDTKSGKKVCGCGTVVLVYRIVCCMGCCLYVGGAVLCVCLLRAPKKPKTITPHLMPQPIALGNNPCRSRELRQGRAMGSHWQVPRIPSRRLIPCVVAHR